MPKNGLLKSPLEAASVQVWNFLTCLLNRVEVANLRPDGDIGSSSSLRSGNRLAGPFGVQSGWKVD